LGNCIAYAVLLVCQIWKLRSDLPDRMERRIYVGLALASAAALLAASLDAGGFPIRRVVLALFLAVTVGMLVRIRPEAGEATPLVVTV
jgi:hypothetical protein